MNSFGQVFRISIYGESHGESVGVLIDGVPAGISLKSDDFEKDILRRKPNKTGTTPRIEEDFPNITSGIFNDKTTGAPINIYFENKNTKSSDYDFVLQTPRPGHADFVASRKYKGFNDYRGGGHFSGRLSLPLVAAGVVAKKIIPEIKIEAKILEIGGEKNYTSVLEKTITEGDSLGGIIECTAKNMPIGLGEPFFNSVESLISHLIFSIPGIKGIEFGNGFEAAKVKGSANNDRIISQDGKTATNNAGGINSGISNGNNLVFRVAIKPTSSISKAQETFNFQTKEMENLKIEGRHDACIALRMPVIVEACTATVLADLMMVSKAR